MVEGPLDRGAAQHKRAGHWTGRSGTWRRRTGRVGAYVNRLPYMSRWLVLASLIGVIAGLGAVVFYEALELSTRFFLGYLAQYHVPRRPAKGAHRGRPATCDRGWSPWW